MLHIWNPNEPFFLRVYIPHITQYAYIMFIIRYFYIPILTLDLCNLSSY